MSDFYERLAQVQEEIGVLEKNADNPFFKSKYADITSMLKQIKPILDKYKFVMIQPSRFEAGVTLQGTVVICTESGKQIESWCDMPEIADPQKKFAASTYFRRLTLQNLLAVPSEDDDGNTASGKAPQKFSKPSGQSKPKGGANRDF